MKSLFATAAVLVMTIAAQAHTISKTPVTVPTGFTGMYISPTAELVVFQVEQDGKVRLDFNGKPGEEYDKVKGLIFSPDGKHFAAVVRDGHRVRVVTDTATGKRYEMVGDGIFTTNQLVFSPDSQHLVYGASTGTGQVVVRDGVESKEVYDINGVAGFTFSPDSKHLAFTAWEQGMAIIDGTPHTNCIRIGKFVYSPDSKHLACIGERLWLDGVDQPNCTSQVISPRYSPDSKHFAYTTIIDGKAKVVVDGKEGTGYDVVFDDTVTFSPDSKQLAYLACREGKMVLVQDGKEGKEYDQPPTRQPLINLFGKVEQPDPETRPSLVFSPDSRHVAFTAKRGTKAFVVIDGKESEANAEVVGLSCNPVINRFAYLGFVQANINGETRTQTQVGVDLTGYGSTFGDNKAVPFFSPDGKFLISPMQSFSSTLVGQVTLLYINNEEVELPCLVKGDIAFDGPNKLRAIGTIDDNWWRVEVTLTNTTKK